MFFSTYKSSRIQTDVGAIFGSTSIGMYFTTYVSTHSAVFPLSLTARSSSNIGSKAYIFNGYGGTSPYYQRSCYVFDNVSLGAISSSYYKQAYACSGPIGTSIYTFGGFGIYNDADTPFYLNTINKYNTVGNTNLNHTSGYAAVYNAFCSKYSTGLIFCGGQTSGVKRDNIDFYDGGISTTAISTLGAGTTSAAASNIGEVAYIFGGTTTVATDTLKKFDGSLTTVATGVGGGTGMACTLNGSIHVFSSVRKIWDGSTLTSFSVTPTVSGIVSSLQGMNIYS